MRWCGVEEVVFDNKSRKKFIKLMTYYEFAKSSPERRAMCLNLERQQLQSACDSVNKNPDNCCYGAVESTVESIQKAVQQGLATYEDFGTSEKELQNLLDTAFMY